VELDLPIAVRPGETFSVTGYLNNPGPIQEDVPVFVLLDVYGEYWFWPGWQHFDSETGAGLDFKLMDVITGSSPFDVFPGHLAGYREPDSEWIIFLRCNAQRNHE